MDLTPLNSDSSNSEGISSPKPSKSSLSKALFYFALWIGFFENCLTAKTGAITSTVINAPKSGEAGNWYSKSFIGQF